MFIRKTRKSSLLLFLHIENIHIQYYVIYSRYIAPPHIHSSSSSSFLMPHFNFWSINRSHIYVVLLCVFFFSPCARTKNTLDAWPAVAAPQHTHTHTPNRYLKTNNNIFVVVGSFGSLCTVLCACTIRPTRIYFSILFGINVCVCFWIFNTLWHDATTMIQMNTIKKQSWL